MVRTISFILLFPLFAQQCVIPQNAPPKDSPSETTAATTSQSNQDQESAVDSDPTVNPPEEKAPDKTVDQGSKQRVTGRILSVGNYCGGAAPPQELLDKLHTPKPMGGMTVVIQSGSDNQKPSQTRSTITTNPDGRWEIKLPPGEYCLLLAPKTEKNPTRPSGGDNISFDENCYADWLKTCDLTFTIGSEPPAKEFDYTIYDRCFLEGRDPCSQYTGPLPP